MSTGTLLVCQVCGVPVTREMLVEDHELLRCFTCIDEDRYAVGTRPADPPTLTQFFKDWWDGGPHMLPALKYSLIFLPVILVVILALLMLIGEPCDMASNVMWCGSGGF